MDPHGRIALKNILKNLGARGKTILISSHILAEMTEFCTSMAIMERGRMVVSGTIDEIRDRVMEGMILLVEVLDGEELFQRIVAEDPESGLVERRDAGHAIHYKGTAAQASDLLTRLVTGGVRVGSFTRRKEGLEELFLKIGAKELS
jgi:ABC-2 type transport system ATP-binding protein